MASVACSQSLPCFCLSFMQGGRHFPSKVVVFLIVAKISLWNALEDLWALDHDNKNDI